MKIYCHLRAASLTGLLLASAVCVAAEARPVRGAAPQSVRGGGGGMAHHGGGGGMQANRGQMNRSEINRGGEVNRGGNVANRTGNRNAAANNSGNRVNANRVNNGNVNIGSNNNVNVNVDNDHGWGWDDHYHPVAAGVAFGTAAAVTSAVVGSMIYSLPPSCAPRPYGGVSYYYCGNVWYEPQYQGDQVTYIVVNQPY